MARGVDTHLACNTCKTGKDRDAVDAQRVRSAKRAIVEKKEAGGGGGDVGMGNGEAGQTACMEGDNEDERRAGRPAMVEQDRPLEDLEL